MSHPSPPIPSGAAQTLGRLSRRARWLAFVPLGAALMLVGGMAAAWISPELRLVALDAALGMGYRTASSAIADYPRAALPLAALSVPVVIFALAMLPLFRLFRRLSSGWSLDRGNARLVSLSGLGLVLFGVAAVLSNTVAVLLLTASNPPGERVLAIGFSSASLGALAAGFALWALGVLLGEAADLADDHASIV